MLHSQLNSKLIFLRRIGETQSADDFYCQMSELMQKALNDRLINGDELIRLSYRVASFPFPHLKQLREKYTYNITPFAAENHEEESDFRFVNLQNKTCRFGSSNGGRRLWWWVEGAVFSSFKAEDPLDASDRPPHVHKIKCYHAVAIGDRKTLIFN